MAIWANDFQVLHGVIFPISIFVMNMQYFHRGISAPFTFCSAEIEEHTF